MIEKNEAQVAVLGGTTNVAEQTKALDQLAETLRAQGMPAAPEIRSLPTRISVREMPAEVDGLPVFGIADDTLAPRGFDPVGSFTIVGPPQSGKTNALRALVVAMERFDPGVKLFHFGNRRAQLADFRPWVRSAVRPDDEKELAAELVDIVSDETVTDRIMIVVEEIPHLADGPADRTMRGLLQAINNSDHILIGESDVSRAGGGSGVLGEWKSARQGIALKPDAYDGDTLFKVPFGRVKRTDFPDGRGIFVQAGRAVTMHLPFVSEDDAAPGAANGVARVSAAAEPANVGG